MSNSINRILASVSGASRLSMLKASNEIVERREQRLSDDEILRSIQRLEMDAGRVTIERSETASSIPASGAPAVDQTELNQPIAPAGQGASAGKKAWSTRFWQGNPNKLSGRHYRSAIQFIH